MSISSHGKPDKGTLRRFARFSRSLELLKIFPSEQKDPAKFYDFLARDTVQLLQLFSPEIFHHKTLHDTGLVNKGNPSPLPVVLDVGAGPGYFAEAFTDQGMRYISVEPDMYELVRTSVPGSDRRNSLCASGYELPLIDQSCDLVMCSNIFEHVRDPWAIADEMIRVCRPGGVVMISYTVWFGPFGGHETGMWHYLGGRYAAERYARKNGHRPKNDFGHSLFKRDVREGLKWAKAITRSNRVSLIAAFPRYHPWWAWFIVKVPLFRELGVSNLMLVLRKSS